MKRFKTVVLVALVAILTGCAALASAQGIADIIPNAEAGKSAWEIFGMIFGSILVGAIGFFLAQISKGYAMGWVVKSWDLIAPKVSCLRFGTATGYYDSPVTKIGPFAVFCETEIDGAVVIDRKPHAELVNSRFTLTNRDSNPKK